MAKKVQEKAPLVRCQECVHGGTEFNHLIDCNSKKANPDGFKMGAWAKPCKYYGKKTNN